MTQICLEYEKVLIYKREGTADSIAVTRINIDYIYRKFDVNECIQSCAAMVDLYGLQIESQNLIVFPSVLNVD